MSIPISEDPWAETSAADLHNLGCQGSSPNWIVLGLWVSLAGFCSGGNLVLDTAVFLEYLPSKEQYLVTTMACWWGAGMASRVNLWHKAYADLASWRLVGQLITGLAAWALYVPFVHLCIDKC